MMNVLSIDIGMRRTGLAFASSETGVPVALTTLRHGKTEDLIAYVRKLAAEKSIDLVVCGLPLLLSGEEGSQCSFVRSIVYLLQKSGLTVTLLDERYTTVTQRGVDGDAAAACQLLLTYIERGKRSGENIDK